MKKERDSSMYLEDMLTGIERILEYTSGLSFDEFYLDNKTIDAVIRNLEVIGEASKKVSEQLKEDNPHFPWEQMYYLRNKMIHEYFGIDLEIIWDIVHNHLPENRNQLVEIIKKEK